MIRQIVDIESAVAINIYLHFYVFRKIINNLQYTLSIGEITGCIYFWKGIIGAVNTVIGH